MNIIFGYGSAKLYRFCFRSTASLLQYLSLIGFSYADT